LTDAKKTIAIVGGTGALGTGIGGRLAKAGYPVLIGSRTLEKAKEAAQTAGHGVVGATNADAAAAAGLIILTIPWASNAAILADIKPFTAGKIIVDTTVPLMPPRVARVQLPPEGCVALTTQARLGEEARVVAAFHAVAAHKLQTDMKIDCDVLVFGEKAEDRDEVIALATAMDLRGLHAGPLGNAIAAEALTSILIGINRTYKVDGAGIRITGF